MKKGEIGFIFVFLIFISLIEFVSADTAISTCQQLQDINNDLTGAYYLASDIDCSDTINWNPPYGFKPIGGYDVASAFSGSFDGKFHKISNLYMNRTGSTSWHSFVGLFGRISGGTVKNTRLENITARGYSSVGGLAGSIYSGSIYNCSVSGNIYGVRDTGGLVGSTSTSGGIIDSCYSTASVRGFGNNIGGFIGYIYSWLVINNSYSTGDVNADGCYIGGFVGKHSIKAGFTVFSIQNSYSTGAVINPAGCYYAGFKGAGIDNAWDRGCFWDKESSGITWGEGGAQGTAALGKITEEMQQLATFVGYYWDFDKVWKINTGFDYPRLNWECDFATCESLGKYCGIWDDNCGGTITCNRVCSTGVCNPATGLCTGCNFNSDCGTNGFVGEPFCQSGDIYQNYRTYTCNNPGTPGSTCNEITSPQLKEDCQPNEICNQGNCILYHSCVNSNDTIIKLYQDINSHGALWNFTNYYWDVCYSEIFNSQYSGANPHECSGNNKILNLYQESNSHAEIPSLSNYNVPVCYGELTCRAADTRIGQNCAEDEKTVVRLSQQTNSHISDAADTNYPIKICCKKQAGPFLSEVHWEDMNKKIINKSDINDLVKLVTGGSRLDLIEYEIWKNNRWWWDKKIAQLSSTGYTIWRAGMKKNGQLETGDYWFRARRVGDTKWNSTLDNSNPEFRYLQVIIPENNFNPVANITSPKKGEIYKTTQTILFNQSSYDVDDFIDYTWDLGDGTKIDGDTVDYINYSFNYQYISSGQKTIKLNVIDDRGFADSDETSILVINPGIAANYVFAWIVKPEYRESVDGPLVKFNANKSYAIEVDSTGNINCLGGNCPITTADGTPISDIYSKKNKFNDLNFSWNFDDNDEHSAFGALGVNFTKIFGTPNSHSANLNLYITGANSSARTLFNVYFINHCNSDGLIWWDLLGSTHSTLTEFNPGCAGLNGVIGGDDDCCPGNYACSLTGCILDNNNQNSCTGIVFCSDYADITSCKKDICKVGWGSDCGKVVYREKSVCGDDYFAKMNCTCKWINSRCELGSDLYGTIFENKIEINYSCLTTVQHGPCTETGLMRVIKNSTLVLDQLYPQCDLNETLCKSEEGVFVCGEARVRLPFFTKGNIIISILLIAIIYCILSLKIKKRKHKTIL